jgi:endonuclease G, mitochondrial
MEIIMKKTAVIVAALLIQSSSVFAGGLLSQLVQHYADDALKTQAEDFHSNNVVMGPQGFSSCATLFPNKTPPQSASFHQSGAVELCSDQFAVFYSTAKKIPIFVVERLNAASLRQASGLQRTNEFYPDSRLSASRQTSLRAYEGSGYDRGHMAPAGDQSSTQAMTQSFALTNIVPQDPQVNRKGGAWYKAELDTRKFVKRVTGDVFVYSVPFVSSGANQTLSRDNVAIPDVFYKVVYWPMGDKVWVYRIENKAYARLEMLSYQDFKRETGYQLVGQ